MGIKNIETEYKGHLFRSRLEARWAVFFDTMGIPYHYEPEGFEMGGIRYLPDFYLPEWKTWIEVKPYLPDPDNPKEMKWIDKFVLLSQHVKESGSHGNETSSHMFMICGHPGVPHISIRKDGRWILKEGYVALNSLVTIPKGEPVDGMQGVRLASYTEVENAVLKGIFTKGIGVVIEMHAFQSYLSKGRVGGFGIEPIYTPCNDVSGLAALPISKFLSDSKIKAIAVSCPTYPSGARDGLYVGGGRTYVSESLVAAYDAAKSARF